jgi:predicted Holliday junction resolvase-like endonuclease
LKAYEKESRETIEDLKLQLEHKDREIEDLGKANQELENNFQEKVSSKVQELASAEIEEKKSLIRSDTVKELIQFILIKTNFRTIYCMRDGIFRCKFGYPDVIGKAQLTILLEKFLKGETH